jgi:nucleoside-diphosphate-sugar epimerase
MSLPHVVITGGAGFIGSHLSRAVLDRDWRVTVIDNMCTGRSANLEELTGSPLFSIRIGDVCEPSTFTDLGGVTHVVHLACPASPIANTRLAVDTIRAGSVGTLNALELAARVGARVVVASSSEIYGDPLVHPQREDYRGNTDPVGPFSAYTEVKRVTEAAAAVSRRAGVDVGIIRPFNVYGPNMWPDDGRVVSSFCAAALRGETLHLQGGGTQTRSFTYVGDFIVGLLAMVDRDLFGPVNLGSEDEISIAALADLVIAVAGSGQLDTVPGREAQPIVRRPDARLARDRLGWQACTDLSEGLHNTLDWMRGVLDRQAVA